VNTNVESSTGGDIVVIADITSVLYLPQGVGMGGDDWLIIYGGSGLFMLIRLIHRAEC